MLFLILQNILKFGNNIKNMYLLLENNGIISAIDEFRNLMYYITTMIFVIALSVSYLYFHK